MTSPSSPQGSSQAQQAALATLAAREAAVLATRVDTANLTAQRDAFTAAWYRILQRYGAASGTTAARFYTRQRTAAVGAGKFTVRPAGPAPLEQVNATTDWALNPLYSADPDRHAFVDRVMGASEKMVQDVGRDTITNAVQEDRKARGWARIPEQNCCAFCALLATRGAVYKEDTVAFQSHDRCRCHPEPVFYAYEPSAQIRAWQQLYQQETTQGNSARTRREWRAAFDKYQADQN